MLNKSTINNLVATMEAYIQTNKEYVDDETLDTLNSTLRDLYDEQRLTLRTVMLVKVDSKPVVVDITDFYDTNIEYDNEVTPDLLQTLCDMLFDKEACLLGYSSPIDWEYWSQVVAQAYSTYDSQVAAINALSKWIEVNK